MTWDWTMLSLGYQAATSLSPEPIVGAPHMSAS